MLAFCDILFSGLNCANTFEKLKLFLDSGRGLLLTVMVGPEVRPVEDHWTRTHSLYIDLTSLPSGCRCGWGAKETPDLSSKGLYKCIHLMVSCFSFNFIFGIFLMIINCFIRSNTNYAKKPVSYRSLFT